MISLNENLGGREKAGEHTGETAAAPQAIVPLKALDSANHFSVVRKDGKILVHNIFVDHPLSLTPEEATNLGMWLLAMSLADIEAVQRALKEIRERLP